MSTSVFACLSVCMFICLSFILLVYSSGSLSLPSVLFSISLSTSLYLAFYVSLSLHMSLSPYLTLCVSVYLCLLIHLLHVPPALSSSFPPHHPLSILPSLPISICLYLCVYNYLSLHSFVCPPACLSGVRRCIISCGGRRYGATCVHSL